jgi:hypothetical protein
MTCRGLALGLLALMGACSAPDYTPVRDWARSASIAADYPAAAPADDGVAAMQEALVVWLSALGVMADDGVLPYPEDPFLTVAPRAAAADARGGEAVAALGRTLRHATRNNLQAPALRDTIRGADPAVQALVAALSDALGRRAALAEVGGVAPTARAERNGAPTARAERNGAPTARVERNGAPTARAERNGAPTARAERNGAPTARAERDGVQTAAATAAERYRALLAQVAAGHAMLKDKAGEITGAETVQRIRAAEDQLRRAARALPLPSQPVAAP